jgi:hypothetical protein
MGQSLFAALGCIYLILAIEFSEICSIYIFALGKDSNVSFLMPRLYICPFPHFLVIRVLRLKNFKNKLIYLQ